MNKVNIITLESTSWTKIEGFSTKGRRVKNWYEKIDDGELFLYKQPKVLKHNGFVTKEIWTELLAYKIGTYIGLNIPEAIPAININDKGIAEYGIIIKSFIERGEAGMPLNELIEAKEILLKINPYNPHNIVSINLLLGAPAFNSDTFIKYLEMLIFDCLIGNNDRHDENWGFIYDRQSELFMLAPIYDNASCLTAGENEEKVIELLSNEEKFEKYLTNSKPPNLYKNTQDKTHYKHFELIKHLISQYPIVTTLITKMLNTDYLDYTKDVLENIQQLEVAEEHKLSNNRKRLILKILDRRREKLKEIINVHH